MVYVIQVCWQLVSRIRTFCPDPAHKLSANLYDIYHCCVQWKTPDDGRRNCPKHVEFYSKNKCEKLVHLVGFIIRIYHDARSPERQILGWIISFFLKLWDPEFFLVSYQSRLYLNLDTCLTQFEIYRTFRHKGFMHLLSGIGVSQ